MNIGLRRVVTASALAVAVAAAGAVPGAVASEPMSAKDGAAAVQRLHDDLAQAVEANDTPAMRWTLGELTPLLTDLGSGQRYAVADEAQEAVAKTSADAMSVKQRIDTMLGERVDLPPIPDLLNQLLQQLLSILSDLFNNLLGGGVPLPVPVPIP